MSLGSAIFLLILLASVRRLKTLVLSPRGNPPLVGTNVRPIPKFLLAGFSFWSSDSFLTSSLAPKRFCCNLLERILASCYVFDSTILLRAGS